MSETINTPVQALQALKEVPLLLRNFPPDDLRQFLESGKMEHYQRHDQILTVESSPATSAYLIVEGKVSIFKDDIHLATLEPGDFLGETFLFTKGSRTANVMAETDTTLVRFDRQETLDYFRRMPERLFKIFIMNIIEIQQRKMVAMNQKLITMQKRLLNKE